MIPYKELTALTFSEGVKFKCEAKKFYSHKDRAVYSAQTCVVKKGSELIRSLVVCIYLEKKTDTGSEWNLSERHFLTENGEMAGQEYLGDGEFRRGDFRIGNAGVTFANQCWYDSISSDLRYGWSDGYVFPYKDADEVIGRFVQSCKVFSGYDVHDFKEGDFKSARMLEWLAQYQCDIMEKKQRDAETRKRQRISDMMSQFTEPPEEVGRWVFGERLTLAPWFYSYDHKRIQTGKCAVCKKKSELIGIKDKLRTRCPKCGAEIECININSKRFGRERSVITWNKSHDIIYHQIIDQRRFISRYFLAYSTYTYNVSTAKITRKNEFIEFRRDFWEIDVGVAKIQSVYEKLGSQWGKLRTMYCRTYGLGEAYPGNLIEVLQATGIPALQNMDIRPLCEKLGLHIAALINGLKRKPIVENLGKEHLYRLAERMIQGYADDIKVCDSLKPYKYLGVSRSVIPYFAEIDVTDSQVKLWRNLKLSEKDAEAFTRLVRLSNEYLAEISEIVQRYHLTTQRVSNYLEKQSAKYKDKAAMFWKDYVASAKQLKIDLAGNRDLLFPPDIKKEHDRCSELVFIQKNEKQSASLQERASVLEPLSWQDKKFIIRPLRTVGEFVRESTELDHCVKTYIERCIETKDNIFALRKINEPDKPFFTVDISNSGTLKENRGLHNIAPNKEVRAFVDKWLKVVKKLLENYSITPESANEQQRVRIGA